MTELPWKRVLAFRLRRHHLLKRAGHDDLDAVVGDMCGVQAQLATAAQVALWNRVEDLRQEDVGHALWESRSLAKTWCMRGTVHLVAARDLPIFLGGLRREGLLREKQWMKRYGLKEENFPRMSQAIEEALASGPMTRKDLADAVVGKVGEWGRPWLEHGYGGVVRLACLEGRICFGADRGQEVTFVRVDQWLPSIEEIPREEAETSLLRRYLRAFGPATPQDFATWSGMRVGAVREIWKRLRPELTEASVEGWEGCLLSDDLEKLTTQAAPRTTVRLLPHFDGYLMGHKAKGHIVPEKYYKRVYRKAGWISPSLLVDGRTAGTWKVKRRARQVDLTVSPFRELSPEVEEALRAEVGMLSHFHDVPVELILAVAR